MRPRGVVVGDPVADEPAGLIEINEQTLVEKFVSHPAVERFDIAVLHRLAGCDGVSLERHPEKEPQRRHGLMRRLSQELGLV